MDAHRQAKEDAIAPGGGRRAGSTGRQRLPERGLAALTAIGMRPTKTRLDEMVQRQGPTSTATHRAGSDACINSGQNDIAAP